MCELLGISNEAPVQVEAMLRAFQRRGGEIADNPDGWGLAFLSDGRFTLGKEPLPAADRPQAASPPRTELPGI